MLFRSPKNSNVDVKTRRTLIATTTALTAGLAIVGAAGGASGSSPSGGSGSGGPSSGSDNSSARKEEEGEMAGEIVGPEGDDDEPKYTKNSIFNYDKKYGGLIYMINWWNFVKKLGHITGPLALTLAGSFIVFITLSGDTRKMAIIATVVALLVHYVYEMLKNDE